MPNKTRTQKYRCGTANCRRIYHFSKPPEAFKTTRTCACGGKLHSYASDRARNKARSCTCDGYPYIHRVGSKWCNFSTVELSDDDFRERYG